MLDRGEIALAERKLKGHLAQNPNDVSAILALIQVYEKVHDLRQLNGLYARVIRHHLERGDKEAAVYAYDGLLSSFPDNKVEVRIPAEDWIVICDYLRQLGMIREAAVEYERLITAHPGDTSAVRACVDGGEAALDVNDVERALRLFEQGLSLYPPPPLASRIAMGI